jgi:hypothetical protein
MEYILKKTYFVQRSNLTYWNSPTGVLSSIVTIIPHRDRRQSITCWKAEDLGEKAPAKARGGHNHEAL